MNQEGLAIRDWLTSNEGKKCADRTTLTIDGPVFLENRLRAAFCAGLSAGKEIASNRIRLAIERIVEVTEP